MDREPDIQWFIPPTPVDEDVEHDMPKRRQFQFCHDQPFPHAMRGLYREPERLDDSNDFGDVVFFALVVNLFFRWHFDVFWKVDEGVISQGLLGAVGVYESDAAHAGQHGVRFCQVASGTFFY